MTKTSRYTAHVDHFARDHLPAPEDMPDFIFGDGDGVVVVPSAIAEKAVALALQKIEAEDTTREELLRGESLKSVFARHGVL